MSLIKLAPRTLFFFIRNPSQIEIIIAARCGTGSQTDCYKTVKSPNDTPLSSIMELLSTLEEVVLWWARAKRWHTMYRWSRDTEPINQITRFPVMKSGNFWQEVFSNVLHKTAYKCALYYYMDIFYRHKLKPLYVMYYSHFSPVSVEFQLHQTSGVTKQVDFFYSVKHIPIKSRKTDVIFSMTQRSMICPFHLNKTALQLNFC